MMSALVSVLVQNIQCDGCVIPKICEACLCLNGHCATCIIQDGYTGLSGYTGSEICVA
jgi:hypothetical protein